MKILKEGLGRGNAAGGRFAGPIDGACTRSRFVGRRLFDSERYVLSTAVAPCCRRAARNQENDDRDEDDESDEDGEGSHGKPQYNPIDSPPKRATTPRRHRVNSSSAVRGCPRPTDKVWRRGTTASLE